MFGGVVGKRPLDNGNDGFITDIFGEAQITNFWLEESAMGFTKQYKHRLGNDAFKITYTFTRNEDETWIGSWEAPAIGGGEARCTLSKIPDNFFMETT